MPYSKQIQEGLKRLIYTGKTEQFKQAFNELARKDKESIHEYLNGTHDESIMVPKDWTTKTKK